MSKDSGSCNVCVEKESIISFQRGQKAKLEERIRNLEAEHDDIQVSSPTTALLRVQSALLQARQSRAAYTSSLPQPLARLAALLQGYQEVKLPSSAKVVAAEDAYEKAQLAITYASSSILI